MRSPSFLAAAHGGGRVTLVNERTGQPIATDVEIAGTSETRRKGLLGRDRLDPSAALIIAPCSAIHMFFMRFAIDAVFVERNGRVRKIVHDLRPWRIALSLGAYAVVEMSSGAVARSDVEVGDRLMIGG